MKITFLGTGAADHDWSRYGEDGVSGRPFHTNETEPQSTSPGSFLTERDLLGWYPATDVPEYGVLEPSPEEITMS